MKFLFTFLLIFSVSINLSAQSKDKTKFRVSQNDSDQDGVEDNKDKCPETPKNTQVDAFGCPKQTATQPDTDNDGVADYQDSCIKTPGIASLNGCPDFDGDGIADHLDKCPKLFGSDLLMGCPDRDNDGISDDIDDCPDDFGLAQFKGCMDSDGDGIADHLDACRNRPGDLLNKGCPEIDKQLQGTLIAAQESIKFDIGSAKISPSSYPFMGKLVEVMQRNQDIKFEIFCFTQESKDKHYNEQLAMNRAAAIESYLISKGVYSKRLTFKSYTKTEKNLPLKSGVNNQTLIEAGFVNP